MAHEPRQNADAPAFLELGVAGRAMPGEKVSGDAHVVATRGSECALLAVVDGLGHGLDAASAARLAVETLGRYTHKTVVSLVRECHQALIGTRGVTLTLADFNAMDETMTWLSIGNVEGMLIRADRTARPAREAIIMRGGVVGYELPVLRAAVIAVSPGDTLYFATDGIEASFSEQTSQAASPQEQADAILERYAKASDDALVLVARYLGRSGGR